MITYNTIEECYGEEIERAATAFSVLGTKEQAELIQVIMAWKDASHSDRWSRMYDITYEKYPELFRNVTGLTYYLERRFL